MSLEDFFTWSEINDGLKAPARVEELIAAMQKGKDSVVENIKDVTKEWSAVASAIGATENDDCLHLFIQLDGLWYLNRWLKDAWSFGYNASESFIEETIINLLRALERLQIESDKLTSSGIWTTMKDLLGHKSSKVQDRARALFNRWEKEKQSDAAQPGVGKIGALDDGVTGVTSEHVGSGSSLSSHRDSNTSKESLAEQKKEESFKGDMPSIDSENLKEEINRTSDDVNMDNEISHSTDSSSLLKPATEDLHTNAEPLECFSEHATLTETCSTAGRKQGDREGDAHAPDLDSTDGEKKMQTIGISPKSIDKVEIPQTNFSIDDTDASETGTGPGVMKISNAIEKDCSSKAVSSAGLRTAIPETKVRIDDDTSLGYCKSSMVFRRKEHGDANSNVLQDSYTNEHKLDIFSGTLFCRVENDGAVEGRCKDRGDQTEGSLSKEYDFPKPRMLRKEYATDKKSDLDLEVDPLEFARQVAIEVEREVEDCRERSGSSSEGELSSKIKQPESPCSISGKECQTARSSHVDMPTRQDLSLDSPTREEHATSAENLDVGQINGTQDGETSQVTEAAQELEANSGKCVSHFDLNEEVFSEDTERQGDVSHPVSLVSASRAAAAPGMPVAPLQFEGSLGWKGSAATSAFRTASPRRVPENDSGLSAGGSNSSSRQNHLSFDLNVCESGDDRMIDLQSRKEIPVGSRLASGESSVGASPRRSDRLELDLNQISNDGDPSPSDWRPEGELFHRRIGHPCQSPSSSSSSKQPYLRNIDLNDQPAFANDSTGNNYYKPSQNLSASGGMRSDDSVISIMGMRVEVTRRNAARTVPLPNGRSVELSDANFVRSGGIFGVGSPALYSHSPVYSYNGLAAGPAIPFSSPMYGPGGPIPYMVDSRGAPVIPQFLGSSSAIPPAFAQQPFVFSMNGMPSSNGVGPLRNNFDLNSGLVLEGGNRDLGGFRQLLNPAHSRPTDDLFKSNSQPSTSSGITSKRKEPEGGWEPYPFKHHSQPWR